MNHDSYLLKSVPISPQEKLTQAIIFRNDTNFRPVVGDVVCAYSWVDGRDIWLTPIGLNADVCGCLAMTLFHETLHLAGRPDTKASEDAIGVLEKKCVVCP